MSRCLVTLNYLGPVWQYALMSKYDTVQIEAFDNFQKASLRNRCHIVGSNGVQLLSIPIEGGREKRMPYREILIANDSPWQQKHWRSLEAAYRNSPYFEYYEDYFRPFYMQPQDYLFEFNEGLRKVLFRLLEIGAVAVLTETYEKAPVINDYRGMEHADGLSPVYYQVFADRLGFIGNLSIVDLLFNLGPGAAPFLKSF
ncbi:MAG: WbqC family protein [Chitinophagales bacterium]|nr:WbqC family protein [Chitinophagales bacterium]